LGQILAAGVPRRFQEQPPATRGTAFVDREDCVMPSVFCIVDDKHIPLYRVMWISDIPHFCGHDDCMHEGDYEIRLEQDESVWATRDERDNMLSAIEAWQGGVDFDEDWR
jgi:hypothetical protein